MARFGGASASVWRCGTTGTATASGEFGEVRPLIDWGIVSLSTSYEHDARDQHEIAWSPRGVVFASGEVCPTYDLAMDSKAAPPK